MFIQPERGPATARFANRFSKMKQLFSRWQFALLPLLAGVLFPLAFAPVALPWFAVLSLAGLWFCWQRATPKQAAWRGFFWGFGAFAIGVSWVHVAIREYGQAPLALSLFLTIGMVAVLALFPALVGWALARFFPASRARVLAFAPLWVLGEGLRSWLFTGFPWLFAGYSQTDTVLANVLPVTGVYGVSLLLALLAMALLGLAQNATARPRSLWLRAALALLLVLVLTPSNRAVLHTPAAPDDGNHAPQLSVALVQANVEQTLKWRPDHLQHIMQLYREMTAPLLGKVDAVIWPEAAVPAFADYLGDYFPTLDAAARQHNTALVTGLPVLDPDERYYNAVVGLGNASGRYDKRHLVPFGEYVPFERWLRGVFAFFDLPMSGMSEGERLQLLQVAGQPMAVAVCYEIAYGSLVRENIRVMNGSAGYLLTVSNDAWFGSSWGPWQHLQIARVRALENGLPVIRATVTGVSAVIGADGRIQQQLPQFETAILRTTVRAQKPDTIWLHFGLWPVSILIALLLGIAGWQQRANSRF